MAVCKTFPADAILEAYDAGQRLFGENRVQEFADKFPKLAELNDADFHMIGHLQSNKTAKAAEIFHAVDSIDSAKLAQRLNDCRRRSWARRSTCSSKSTSAAKKPRADSRPTRPNSTPSSPSAAVDEPAHPRPDDRSALHRRSRRRAPLLPQAARIARPARRAQLAAVTLDVLSMGMSHDFEVAIEEGSTCVRIGTAIFGDATQTVIPIRDTPAGATFQVKVHPRAKKNAITGERRRRAQAVAHHASRRRPRQRGLHRLPCEIFECSAFVSYDSRRRIQPPKVDSYRRTVGPRRWKKSCARCSADSIDVSPEHGT